MAEPFRILEVGCSDGAIGAWLTRKLQDHGRTVEYHGVEADEATCQAAADRFRELGLPPIFRHGTLDDLAYDATVEDRIEPYDAVIAFEVIEHVPHEGSFLRSLEALLKPNGVIYLSTPNGTFGTGSNPAHLRVYDTEELLDLLRHRGTLVSGLAGSDGVTCAAYKPAPRKGDVAIYTGGAWERWAPQHIETRGLGGSETAAVRLAEALDRQGYVVTVYGDVDRGMIGQVRYDHHTCFDPLESRDAVIASRIPELFDHHVNAAAKILWLHDVDCADRLTPERAARLDRIATLSQWHAQHILGAYPFLRPGDLLHTGNGIHAPYFPDPAPWTERPHQLVYSSSPDRGLDVLLHPWPRVREQVPDAELVHLYAPVYQRVADQIPQIAAYRQHITDLSDQPGVTALGGLSQPELAKLMMSSRVWAAPSYATPHAQPFNETFCIGAVEAGAAGCWRIGSSWGALVERGLERMIGAVGNDPHTAVDAWVDAIVAGLTHETGPPAFAREQALVLSWDRVAGDFARAIETKR